LGIFDFTDRNTNTFDYWEYNSNDAEFYRYQWTLYFKNNYFDFIIFWFAEYKNNQKRQEVILLTFLVLRIIINIHNKIVLSYFKNIFLNPKNSYR